MHLRREQRFDADEGCWFPDQRLPRSACEMIYLTAAGSGSSFLTTECCVPVPPMTSSYWVPRTGNSADEPQARPVSKGSLRRPAGGASGPVARDDHAGPPVILGR